MASAQVLAPKIDDYDTPGYSYITAVYVPDPPKQRPAVTYKPYPASEVTEYIKEVFGANAGTALVVAKCESGFNPYIVNNNPRTRDYSVGVFQINIYGDLALNRPSEAWLKDYKNNINYAYKMFQNRGWKDWTCYR